MSKKIFSLQNLLLLAVLIFIGRQFHIANLDGSGPVGEGKVQLFHNQYQDALASFDRALSEIERSGQAMFFSKGLTVAKTRNRLKALHGKGCAHAGLRNDREAEMYFSQVLEANPFYTESLSKRAETRFRLEDYQGCADDCTRILSAAPRAFHILVRRANAYVKLGEHEKAIDDFERGIRFSSDGVPRTERLYFMNSLAALLSTCPEKALRDGPRAVELASELISAAESMLDKNAGATTLAGFYDTLAAARAQNGDFPGAAQAARSALQHAENAPPGGNRLDKTKLEDHLRAFESKTLWWD